MINGSWNDDAARHCRSALALRAYTSRLIGRDTSLVLHGGGNTSMKDGGTLYVKGTGANLADVCETDFTAMDLDALRVLLQQDGLSDTELMLRIDSCKLSPASPKPSIETLLHAALPFVHVEHAHADAVLAVVNVEKSSTACAAAFGNLAPVVPYRHSGAALARACKQVFEREATDDTIGLILAFHGVVAFGDTARESYDNLLRLVGMAETYLLQHQIPHAPETAPTHRVNDAGVLCGKASAVAGFPLKMHLLRTPETLAFAQRPDLAKISQQGPPTPQHAIYTKRTPLIDGDVEAYAGRYREYLSRTLGTAADGRIDAAPRIALDPAFGLCAFGINDHYAKVAAEIYLHDIDIITRASAHGTYRSAPAIDIARAELEYGGFEQHIRRQKD